MYQCLAWLMLLATNTPAWATENLNLSASTELSNEGYFVLDWQTGQDPLDLTLQQSSDESFSNIIERDISGESAITITGLSDGVYYFRILDSGDSASNTVTVSVVHHSLLRAGGFFALGLILFSLLIVTILIGNRRAGI